jgi:hypothetical protein
MPGNNHPSGGGQRTVFYKRPTRKSRSIGSIIHIDKELDIVNGSKKMGDE